MKSGPKYRTPYSVHELQGAQVTHRSIHQPLHWLGVGLDTISISDFVNPALSILSPKPYAMCRPPFEIRPPFARTLIALVRSIPTRPLIVSLIVKNAFDYTEDLPPSPP